MVSRRDKVGFQSDLDTRERLRYRTAMLRSSCVLCEGRLVDARHLGLADEMALGDLESVRAPLDREVRGGIDMLRFEPSLAQYQGERHGKVLRVGGGCPLRYGSRADIRRIRLYKRLSCREILSRR